MLVLNLKWYHSSCHFNSIETGFSYLLKGQSVRRSCAFWGVWRVLLKAEDVHQICVAKCILSWEGPTMKIFEELWVLNEPIKGHNHAMIHKRTCLQLIIKNHALESLLIVFLSPSPSSRLLSCEMAHQPLRYTGGNGKFLRKEKKIDRIGCAEE